MMRGRIRRLVVCGAVTGLLAAGAVTAGMGVAHADGQVGRCLGTADDAYKCSISVNISGPATITLAVTDDGTNNASEDVTAAVTELSCTDNNGTASEPNSSTTGPTPLTDNLTPLPATADGTCTVDVTMSLPTTQPVPTGTTFTPTEFTATLSYTSAVSPTPTPSSTSTGSASAVHPVKGFDGKCLDDKGNSSSNRAEVVIWSCSGSDQAENWQYSSNEFKHNGKCLNDQGNGGIRSKVILWSCNGAANEKWSELANRELKLQSHGGSLCLDDPRSSTKNGTQLIVYTCTDSANQKWELP
jgi:Ricin-type beta-trefoil lectin domain